MSDPSRVDAVLLRRSGVLRNVGIALGLVALAIGLVGHGDLRLLWFIGLGTVGFTLALLGLEGSPRRLAASLGPDGVRVDGALVVSRTSIRSGWFERGHETSLVRLHRRVLPDVVLESKDDVEARTLLRALERDASQSIVRFPSSSRAVGFLGAVAGQMMAHVFARSGRVEPLFMLASIATLGLVFFLWRDETSIGSDGVLVSRLLRRRFIPFAAIESAFVDGHDRVVLQTRTHGTIVRRMKEAVARAAVEQIQSAMASLDASSGSEAIRLRLRRTGKDGDVVAWIARLRALANRGSYRAVGLVGDALWRVMDDPSASSTERAAAAVVLGAVATPAERLRLREAAGRMASPRVRVAIELVAGAPADPAAPDVGETLPETREEGGVDAPRARVAAGHGPRNENNRWNESAELELAGALEALSLEDAKL